MDGPRGEPPANDDKRPMSASAPVSLAPAGGAAAIVAPRPLAITLADPLEARERPLSENVLHLWHIIVKWRWAIAAATIAGLAAGVIMTLITTPIYRATTTIQIDKEPPKVQTIGTPQYDWEDPDKYYLTQYELLKSRTLAERVAQSSDLADDDALFHPPETRPLWSRLFPHKAAPATQTSHFQRAAAAAGIVSGGLTIMPVRASRLVKISFDSPDPGTASKIANAVAQSYISWNLERRFEASAAARKYLEDKLAETRAALQASQQKGSAYDQQNGLINIGGAAADPKTGSTGESIDAADLSALDQSLSAATAARIQAQQHLTQAQSTPDASLPELVSDTAYQSLRATRDTAMAEYQQNLKIYRPNFPSMVEAKAKIDSLAQQMVGVANAVRGSLKAQYEIATRNEGQLRGEVDRRKGGLLASQAKRVQESVIDTDISTDRTLYDSMLATYKQIGVSGAVQDNNISVVDPAMKPGFPIRPQPMLNLMLYGSLGVALGVMLAFLLEQLDLSMKVPEDVEKELGLPVLATIPILTGAISAVRALENPKSQLSEGYYSARAALELSTEDGVPANLVITSSMKGEGKSTSALALASGFGRLGMRVLLIDADMRNPVQHRLLARDNSIGLSNLLAGSAELAPAFQPTGYANLTFLSAGRPPPNPSELLAGGKMVSLLKAARDHFDLVVVDAPPVMGLADAPQLASIAEGVLMVVEANATKRDIARNSMRRLRAVNARLLGALFTKFDIKKAGYAYGYAYSYGYGRGYGFDYETPAPVGRLAGLLKLAQSNASRRRDD
ncbi:MAG TPA: polysaccharide biosynthesis tyrosine autokinase [Caulobacteraceae bacterium]|nr:polysaccharide biosynthesis tyrosine autokinase [Caulobacteraceae bacterium]